MPWDDYLDYCLEKKTFHHNDLPRVSDPVVQGEQQVFDVQKLKEQNRSKKTIENSGFEETQSQNDDDDSFKSAKDYLDDDLSFESAKDEIECTQIQSKSENVLQLNGEAKLNGGTVNH